MIILSVSFESQSPLSYVSLTIPPMVSYVIYVYVRAHIYLNKMNIGKKISIVRAQTIHLNDQRRTLKQMKVLRLILFMLLSLCICYLPYCVAYATSIALGKETPHFLDTLRKATELFAVTKCLINPILYYNSNFVLRARMRKVTNLGVETADVINTSMYTD